MKKFSLLVVIGLAATMFGTSCANDCVRCQYSAFGIQVDEELCDVTQQEEDAFVAGHEIAAAFAGTTADCD